MCLGIPGEIVDVHIEHDVRYGRVRFGGITREVCLECQPDAGPGDFVLVHVGFAIATLDRAEAARTWALLEEIGQTAELAADSDERAEGIARSFADANAPAAAPRAPSQEETP